MIVWGPNDANDAFLYALEWRRSMDPKTWLYWSAWVGWTPDVNKALVLTASEVENVGRLVDALPIKAAGMWEPVFRLIPLFEDDE